MSEITSRARHASRLIRLVAVAIVALLLLEAARAKEIPEYINTWLVLGAFDSDGSGAGFDREWIDEKSTQIKEGTSVAGKTWTYFDDRLFSRNYDNYQDLWSYYRIKLDSSITNKAVYAYTNVFSERAQKVTLSVGADNRSRVFLNGAPVLESAEGQWRRDSVQKSVDLKAGWNQILVKVANQQDGRLGFYLRISDAKGNRASGLTWSVQGEAPKFEIATKGMAHIKTGLLPTGWKEWSYISAQPDPKAIFPEGSVTDEKRFLLYRVVHNPDYSFKDPSSVLQASEFRLQAQGGRPPYTWSAMGDLPPGLEVSTDGAILGRVAEWAESKTYNFTVRAKDADGQVAKRALSIEIQERPNKWYEEARLVGLVHAPEYLEENKIDPMVSLMQRQGYRVVMPISYNNGEMAFRWPSSYAPKGTKDTVGKFKAAVNKSGMKFGIYMGNLNRDNDKRSLFKNVEQHLMLREAIMRYQPLALWFDWSTIEAESIDSIYSMIRTINPQIVIIINGSQRGTFGDWDEICFEGWSAWGWNIWDIWPVDFPWPKKHAPESWRFITETGLTPGTRLLPNGPALNDPADWQEYLRVQLSLIGEGFVANIDHSHSLRLGKRSWDQPDDAKPVPYNEAPLIKVHEDMANWASPRGLPPLYTSFTEVNPGPLGEASWGYNLINLKRDTIYLHLMKNARGKTGMPEEKSITVGPIDEEVSAVTWMNSNRPLRFRQELTSTNKFVTIYLDGVTPDPIDTILKIQLKKAVPIPAPDLRLSVPEGNLASFRPSRQLGIKGSPVLLPSKSHVASYGNDGNPKTVSKGGGEWSWIYEVDLESVHAIKRVNVLYTERGFPTASEVLVSDDGKNWTKVGEEQRSEPGWAKYEFSPTDARYIRVKALKPDGPKQPGIQMAVAEVEVYE